MSGFWVRVLDRNGAAVLLPADVTLAPSSWAASAVGGPTTAEIEATGDTGALLGLAAWLGYALEICNEAGQVVWWGQMVSLDVLANGVRRGLSIGDVVNRLRLLYVRQVAGGGEESAETDWIEDTASSALYGQREKIYSAGSMTQAQAEATAALLLSKLAKPQRWVRVESGGNAASGKLACRGWFARLDDVYFSNTSGLEAHVVDTTEAQPVGLGFSSVALGFSNRKSTRYMHDVTGKLATIGAYDGIQVVVSGSLLNDGTKTIETGDRKEPVIYESNLISFAVSDDMYDENAGLSFIASDDVIFVSGASQEENLGPRLVKTTGANHIEVSPDAMGGFVDSGGVGPTITVRRGNRVTLAEAVVGESPDWVTTKTVATYGQRVYQAFGLAANGEWTVAAVEVRARRVGSPADSLRVGLYTDSGGAPGTLLEQSTLAAASVPEESGWVAFSFGNTAQLNYGTTYGLLIDRTGAMDAEDFYEVEVDPDGGYTRGGMALYDGSTYHAATADLVFRVLGAVASMDLAVTVVTEAGTEIERSIVEAASGVDAWQYATGEETAGTVLRRLLDQGDSLGRRLLAQVMPDLSLRLYGQPYDSEAWVQWDRDALRTLDGAPVQDGWLPVGGWLVLADDALTSDAWARLDRVFVERATFRVGSGLDFEAEGQRSILERLGVQQG